MEFITSQYIKNGLGSPIFPSTSIILAVLPKRHWEKCWNDYCEKSTYCPKGTVRFPASNGTINTAWSSWKEVVFKKPLWSWQSKEALTDFSQQHLFPSVNYILFHDIFLILTIKVSRSLEKYPPPFPTATVTKWLKSCSIYSKQFEWIIFCESVRSSVKGQCWRRGTKENIKFTKVEEILAWKTQLWCFEDLSSPLERPGPWTHTGTQADLWRKALWGSMDRGEGEI